MKTLLMIRPFSASLAGVMLASAIGASSTAQANELEEAAAACTEAARLISEDDDLDGAIEEASWCLTGLKQLKEEIKLSLLPDELLGFVGGELQNENIMGMSTVKRVYSKDSEQLSVSLITTGGAAGALSGLGELGKLFGALENAGATSGKKIRIQRRTVIVSGDGGKGALTVQLKSGGTLQVESQDLTSDELVTFMREFPIKEIDEATKP